MKKILFFNFLFLATTIIIADISDANGRPIENDMMVKIANFLDVDANRISSECPQDSFGIKGSGSDERLYFCLGSRDTQKRCEIAISGLDSPPARYQISFDVRKDSSSVSDHWYSIMQIHSFPDFGEKWRCPPLSVEINKQSFRAYSRWDKSEISKTYGYNCAEEGSSITSTELINHVVVRYNVWNRLTLDIFATHIDNGAIKININESSSELKNRGNLYNDKAPPYLKLGVYKPAGWTKSEIKENKKVCVSYKNFMLKTSKTE
jgi:Polysaccharide lyase